MKNINMTIFTACLYSLAIAVMFGVWAALVFQGGNLPGAPVFIEFIKGMLLLLTGHILTLLGQTVPNAPPDTMASPQTGFANPVMLGLIVICMSLALTACTTVQLKDAGDIAVGVVDVADIFAEPDPIPTPLCAFSTNPPTFGPCPTGVKP